MEVGLETQEADHVAFGRRRHALRRLHVDERDLAEVEAMQLRELRQDQHLRIAVGVGKLFAFELLRARELHAGRQHKALGAADVRQPCNGMDRHLLRREQRRPESRRAADRHRTRTQELHHVVARLHPLGRDLQAFVLEIAERICDRELCTDLGVAGRHDIDGGLLQLCLGAGVGRRDAAQRGGHPEGECRDAPTGPHLVDLRLPSHRRLLCKSNEIRPLICIFGARDEVHPSRAPAASGCANRQARNGACAQLMGARQ